MVVDSHIHCGVQNVSQPLEIIRPLLNGADIGAACLFAPVEDIYDRTDRNFHDSPDWKKTRQRAHDYLLDLSSKDSHLHPYFFVWNDFDIDALDQRFQGIKWHHHAGEPPYRYDDPKCLDMIEVICRRKLPVVLEETYDRTTWFIDRIAGRTSIIIPHLGLLNGGFDTLMAAGVWDNPTVFADTALAGPYEIYGFLNRYGAERLIFGSDFPFGMPGPQLNQLLNMGLSENERDHICSQNILRLLKMASSNSASRT